MRFRRGQGLQDIGVTLRQPVSKVILVLDGFTLFLSFSLPFCFCLPLSLQSRLYKGYKHFWYDVRVMDLCLVQRFIPLYSSPFVDPRALKYVSLSPFILAIRRGRKSKLKLSLKVSLEPRVHPMSSSTNLLSSVKGPGEDPESEGSLVLIYALHWNWFHPFSLMFIVHIFIYLLWKV